jgi:hypothetical protein
MPVRTVTITEVLKGITIPEMECGLYLASGQRRPRPAALDAAGGARDFTPVETQPIKILGQLHKTSWQRFARLQRTAAQLARGRGQPKGVFRFSSNEACSAWTASLNRNAK